MGNNKAAAERFGLDVMVSLKARRKSWLADDQFKVVLETG